MQITWNVAVSTRNTPLLSRGVGRDSGPRDGRSGKLESCTVFGLIETREIVITTTTTTTLTRRQEKREPAGSRARGATRNSITIIGGRFFGEVPVEKQLRLCLDDE